MPTAPGVHPHFNDRGALWALHMPWARSLPFVFYTNEKGQFLHGTSGGRSAAELLDDIGQVVSRKWK